MTHLQPAHLVQRLQSLGQVERRRQPLPPRRRAQPRQVDDVGLAAQVLGTGERFAGVVDVIGVDQHDVDQRQQRFDGVIVSMR